VFQEMRIIISVDLGFHIKIINNLKFII